MFQPEKLQDLIAKQAEPAPFSLESLIAWLEKQPGDKGYCFTNIGECLWGAYTVAHGGSVINRGNAYQIGDVVIDAGLDFGGHGWRDYIAAGRPRTYSDALKRARAIAARAS